MFGYPLFTICTVLVTVIILYTTCVFCKMRSNALSQHLQMTDDDQWHEHRIKKRSITYEDDKRPSGPVSSTHRYIDFNQRLIASKLSSSEPLPPINYDLIMTHRDIDFNKRLIDYRINSGEPLPQIDHDQAGVSYHFDSGFIRKSTQNRIISTSRSVQSGGIMTSTIMIRNINEGSSISVNDVTDRTDDQTNGTSTSASAYHDDRTIKTTTSSTPHLTIQSDLQLSTSTPHQHQFGPKTTTYHSDDDHDANSTKVSTLSHRDNVISPTSGVNHGHTQSVTPRASPKWINFNERLMDYKLNPKKPLNPLDELSTTEATVSRKDLIKFEINIGNVLKHLARLDSSNETDSDERTMNRASDNITYTRFTFPDKPSFSVITFTKPTPTTRDYLRFTLPEEEDSEEETLGTRPYERTPPPPTKSTKDDYIPTIYYLPMRLDKFFNKVMGELDEGANNFATVNPDGESTGPTTKQTAKILKFTFRTTTNTTNTITTNSTTTPLAASAVMM